MEAPGSPVIEERAFPEAGPEAVDLDPPVLQRNQSMELPDLLRQVSLEEQQGTITMEEKMHLKKTLSSSEQGAQLQAAKDHLAMLRETRARAEREAAAIAALKKEKEPQQAEEAEKEEEEEEEGDIPMFDMMFYHCVPMLGEYGDDYEILEPALVTRLPRKKVQRVQFPPAMNAALAARPVSKCYEDGQGGMQLPKLNGDYAWPKRMRLSQAGRGAVGFTVASETEGIMVGFSQGPYPFEPMAEVVLGGWGNAQSTITTKRNGYILDSAPLAVKKGDQFWVWLYDGQILVGTGPKIGDPATVVMQATVPVPRVHPNAGHQALSLDLALHVGFGTYDHPCTLEDVRLADPKRRLPQAAVVPVVKTAQGLRQHQVIVQPLGGNYVFPSHLRLPRTGRGAVSFTLRQVSDDFPLQNVWCALTAGPYLHDRIAEVVIGGWENRQSCIRSENRGRARCAAPIPAQDGQSYWIALTERKVSVGLGTVIGQDEFMWASMSGLRHLRQIAFGGWETPIVFENVKTYEVQADEYGDIMDVREAPLPGSSQARVEAARAECEAPTPVKAPAEKPAEKDEGAEKEAPVVEEFYLVVHNKPQPPIEGQSNVLNVLPHAWSFPSVQFNPALNVTKKLFMGVFEPSAAIVARPALAEPEVEEVGLNLGGAMSFGKLSERFAFIHDQRFSPNNAQLEVIYGMEHCSSFYIVALDDGTCVGNSGDFGGPSEDKKARRRAVASLHVIPGSDEMKELLFRPCNYNTVDGFLEQLQLAIDKAKESDPEVAQAAMRLHAQVKRLITPVERQY